MIYTSREVYEYISRQTNDPIIEWKTCAISGTQFPIYQSDLDFYTKISPTFAGQKFQIPTPTLCPEERQRRRLSFRNERKLYRRQCDASKQSIISIYSPDKPYKVYDQKIWRSDARDPMDYGMNFDFSKTFTENFRELMREVPRISLLNGFSENTEYANHARRQKDCYLSFAAGENENCMYGSYMNKCYLCIDGANIYQSKYLYDAIDCDDCYNCFSVNNLKGCNLCYYSQYLENCSFCFGCTNLQNKKFYVYNKPYSELEYHAITQKLIIQSGDSYRSINHILCACNIFSSQECMGNAIKNSYKSLFIFDSYDSSKCKSSTHIRGGTNVYDCDIAGSNDSFNLFEGHTVIGSNHIFGNLIRGGDSNIYCDYLLGVCNNLFGCIGLRNKSYCIFNKQYTKEEYEKQVAKIIAHMQSTGERGEFFHPSLSPFGYNETVAQEYFPLQSITDNSEGLELTDPLNNSVNFGTFGYHRSTYSSDPIIPEGVKAIDCRGTEWAPESEGWKQLNETTLDPSATNYDICKQIIVCEVSGRPFMLQKAEIDFYRKHHIPLPRKHPDIRHEERMKLRPGRTLFLRNCDCCGKEMLSVYPQDHEGKVYCEECYQKEVYG